MTVISLCSQEVVFSGQLDNNVDGRSGKTFIAIQMPEEAAGQHELRMLAGIKRMANLYLKSKYQDELEVQVVIRKSSNEIIVQEKSHLLKALGILIGSENIRLKLTLSGLSGFHRSSSRRQIEGKVCTKEMEIWEDSATVCADFNIQFPSPTWLTAFRRNLADIYCHVTLEAILTDSNSKQGSKLLDSKPDRMTTYKKLLNEEIHSDTIIVAKNGHEMKTHKAILSACSNVLEAMFQTDMVEAKTHQVKMPDMTEEGLKAFLAYVYYLSEEDADKDCSIAYELLNAGHKYNVLPDLEKAMISLMLHKPADWYGVDVAVKTFVLARNLESGGNLKLKCVQVLKSKCKALCDSEAYTGLFKKDPAAAMELCQLSFSTNS